MRAGILALCAICHTAGGTPPHGSDGWKFLQQYPPQYIAQQLGAGEAITIDGILNETAWRDVPWTSKKFEDIAAPLFPHLVPPEAYQTRAKVRWDADFLYIAAEISEPVVWGNITGHNEGLTEHKAPWWNNDFEVFVDVSGTTHYYKEFEMNARNATYDVLWRVPDGGMNSIGVPCDDTSAEAWCQNSTYNSGQLWTMYPRMQTAVSHPGSLNPFATPAWIVEIAFPITAREGSGGLLDADPQHDFSQYHPSRGARYWWVNFARAEHPLQTIGTDPLGIDFFSQEYQDLCAEVKGQYPSLLGTGPWSCYWEFVWQNAGQTQYMHNPEMWGMVQFAQAGAAAECRNVEWPARYIANQLQRAQIAVYQSQGKYTTDVAVLASSEFCSNATGCDAVAVSSALADFRSVFTVKVAVDSTATRCVDYKAKAGSGAPCFNVSVTTVIPQTNSTVCAVVSENRYTQVTSSLASAGECL